jgi:hypothetical protein
MMKAAGKVNSDRFNKDRDAAKGSDDEAMWRSPFGVLGGDQQ